MPIELKFFPHFQHLTRDRMSMVLLDVKSATIMAVSRSMATVLEEVYRHGSINEESIRSAECLLLLYGNSSEDANLAISEVLALRDKGYFQEKETERGHGAKRSAIVLNVSHTCQLKCTYCFAAQGSFGKSDTDALMTMETGKRAIDFFLENADPSVETYSITYFGGEPMMNWDIIETLTLYAIAQAAALGKKVRFIITTNGYNVDEVKARFMYDHGFSVMVSIDGNRDLHNALRPHTDSCEDSYNLSITAINQFVKTFGKVTASATVTSSCIDPRIVASYLKEAGVTDILTALVEYSPVSRATVSPKELQTYTRGLEEMFFSNDYMFRSLFGQYISQIGAPMLYPSICGFGDSTFCVDGSGRIYACQRVVENEQFYLGDIYNGLVPSQVDTMVSYKSIANILGCRTCWARYLCGGTCPGVSYESTGSHYVPDSHTCYIRQRMVEHAIEAHLISQLSR